MPLTNIDELGEVCDEKKRTNDARQNNSLAYAENCVHAFVATLFPHGKRKEDHDAEAVIANE